VNIKHSYYFFKKAIPKKICNQIIKKFSKLNLSKGTTKGEVKKIRDSEIIFTSESFLYDLINPYIHAANKNAGWNFEWDHTEPLQFTKYALNEHYNWHTDAAPEPYQDKTKKYSYGKIRKLSSVVSLVDRSKYKGGDFQLDLRNKEINFEKKENQDVRNILTLNELNEAGTIVVFPSFLWHRVTPVTKGTRYSLVGWSLGQPWR
jgi:PKHD-type hydroxylase